VNMTHPRCAFGASPSRGRPQRPGKAGSAAALEEAARFAAAVLSLMENQGG
jgi:hypothetical protein